jgi:hypothetical protein
MQKKELEGIMSAIILAGMIEDRDNNDCRDQKILDAVRMAEALQSALADRGPIENRLREYYRGRARAGMEPREP